MGGDSWDTTSSTCSRATLRRTRPSSRSGTAELLPGTLRYPGGNLGDWWDWRTGWCVTNTSVPGCTGSHCPTNPCYAGRDSEKPVRHYPIEEFQTALHASGATAVILVNMWTSSLGNQLAFLQHARAIGALPPGSYIEVGGEVKLIIVY